MFEHQSTATPLASPAAGQAGCHFSDDNGVRWSVSEKQSENRAPALYFESDAAFRRVTHYPLDWRNLSGAELELLSHHR